MVKNYQSLFYSQTRGYHKKRGFKTVYMNLILHINCNIVSYSEGKNWVLTKLEVKLII